MRPKYLNTKIFLDSSSIKECKLLIEKMGFLDGQTTNPSNFVKALAEESGSEQFKFKREELYSLYKNRVVEISKEIPCGSVSIEVYSDKNTTAEEMIEQGNIMFKWIPNAHIKLPITIAGLTAAKELVSEGKRVNMTLCFTQEQAAAVYVATSGAKKGEVFVSPFVGRIDDTGRNGIDLIKNIIKMYSSGDGHVEVLAASIRTGKQMSEAIALGADGVTSYLKAILEWFDTEIFITSKDLVAKDGLTPIKYEELSLEKNFDKYLIKNEMTDKGLISFAKDWNSLIQ